MKKKLNETDFIGGQGSLTKEEEVALSQYFARKKNKKSRSSDLHQLRSNQKKAHA
jgi:hypothetical protein